VWIVLAGSKVNVGAPGVSDGAERCSFVSDVNAHVRKVTAECVLHLRADVCRQRETTGFLSQRPLERFHTMAAFALDRFSRRRSTGRQSRIPQIETCLQSTIAAD